jgi:tetratricopeptide (TPR) repeat protein
VNAPAQTIQRTTIPLALAVVLASLGCNNFASSGMNVDGVRLYQQGAYPEAAGRFMHAIASDPLAADGYYNLAATYHQIGSLQGRQEELQQAEALYNQCLDRDPDHVECHRGLAVLLVETGRGDAADRLLKGWAARSPSIPDPKIELARLMEEQGDFDNAKLRLEEALVLDPHNSRALASLGRLHERLGDASQALSDYERSLAMDEFQPQVASRVASLRGMVGQVAQPAPTSDTRIVSQPTSTNRY